MKDKLNKMKGENRMILTRKQFDILALLAKEKVRPLSVKLRRKSAILLEL